MERQGQVVRRINVDDVETRLTAPQCGLPMPAAHVGDIPLRHSVGLCGIVRGHDDVGHAHRWQAREPVGRMVTVVGQFDRGERAMRLDCFGGPCHTCDVPGVPKAAFRIR